MRRFSNISRPLARAGHCSRLAIRHTTSPLPIQLKQGFRSNAATRAARKRKGSSWPLIIFTGGLFIWWLYPTDGFAQLASTSPANRKASRQKTNQESHGGRHAQDGDEEEDEVEEEGEEEELSAWGSFAKRFESISIMTDNEWFDFSDKLVDYVLPDWSKLIPGYLKKLQKELSMSSGSLADEIWSEAHDPSVNPEIRYKAKVRVSSELCKEEQEYLARRRRMVTVALAKYLEIDEKDIHPDDVPTIAMCGSGGGMRALVAGTGSMLATEEDGLFDCVTYTSGVSGSCWLQMLYLTSFTKGSIRSLLEHLKSRAGTHIAYPPVALQSLVSLPTSKYLLSGMVEKLKGDPHADFGLVDIYGLLLASRYLVPRGELGVSDRDFKLSNQQEFMKHGQRPLPIYTAVRHEIPDVEDVTGKSDKAKEAAIAKAKKETWFQWYEITPYELFCEEVGAGIPTWAIGRRFKGGDDVPPESGFHLPEVRLPLLMGIFGSAFCATLSHYYKEIQPLVQSMSGFGAVDELISGKDEDMSKIHPIEPARIPNFAYGMQDKLPQVNPTSICDNEYIQLMDAGMSNNLPIYPLLRPGRNVDILVSFDASADIKSDNWLSVADGYARERGIKGWPVGVGWPKQGESVKQAKKELEKAQAESAQDADRKVQEAKADQKSMRKEATEGGKDVKSKEGDDKFNPADEQAGDLGPCTVWVGSTQERAADAPPSKAITDEDSWKIKQADAGITIVYLPFLANKKVPGVSPGTSEYLSTWNFVYTPEQIDKVVQLARANYDEGKQQIRSTVRAVYERKKEQREEEEQRQRDDSRRKLASRADAALLGEGDQFS